MWGDWFILSGLSYNVCLMSHYSQISVSISFNQDTQHNSLQKLCPWHIQMYIYIYNDS